MKIIAKSKAKTADYTKKKLLVQSRQAATSATCAFTGVR